MRLARRIGIAAVIAFLPLTAAYGDVVINEVFYNAPEDRDDVQWIELHNTAAEAVDLTGWSLDEGKGFVFPMGARIEGRGYQIVALDPDAFTKSYGLPALGPLKRPLKRGGERIELRNAGGKPVDVARYKDREPWPASADGYSASLERICPTAPGEGPENWAASPLPATPRPSGTPGKPNASYSPALPPVIGIVTTTPEDLLPGQPLQVGAEVKEREELREATLLYQVVTGGAQGKEVAVTMSRDAASGRYRGSVPAQAAGTLIRYRLQVVARSGARRLYPAAHDLRPTLSAYVHEPWKPARIPFGLILHVAADPTPPEDGALPTPPRRGRPGENGFRAFGRFGEPSAPRPPRGRSAFVFVDPKSGKTTLFDHVNVLTRGQAGWERGYRIFFHKDRPLNGMSAVNLVMEGMEPFLMAEALAYDVYRRAGHAAPMAEFVRVWVDGRMVGYHLMVERPNRSFLRRNKINDEGNLYKLLYYGQGIVGQHKKRTHIQTGHDDIVAIIQRLRKTKGDEQWTVIEESFNVGQVATYFAVNTVLSHWDGFFNNYFTYHDTQRTKKWEIYPWDQDKTWGYHDGRGENEVFFDMPLTFGMEGDLPPRGGRGGGFGGPFGGGVAWWRPPGHFSGPLLANPRFRQIFLARVREIVERVYTKESYFPLIDEMAGRVREDSILRAAARGEDAESATQALARNVELLKTHVIKRRQFLLEQAELRSLRP